MTDRDDIDDLAGEYVLGTLDAAERASVAARRQREPALDAAIEAWERRLSPLNAYAHDVAPPPELFAKILRRIAALAAGGENVTDLTRRLKRWRAVALAASAVAAALVAVVGLQTFGPKPKQKNLVAVLQKDAASPAFLVTVNVDDRIMTVRPVAAPKQPGKSYELWIVNETLGKPRSLGVIDEGRQATRPQLAAYSKKVIEDSTYAVSLEPEGGSPTGQPTGPVVFSGKMMEAPAF